MHRLIAFFCIALLGSAGAALAEGRVALVIGNAAYLHVPALPNPKSDAAAVAESFRKAGFDKVYVANDLDQGVMRRALQEFSRVARGAEVAAVYFAGHGVEIGGTNYLVPTDAELQNAGDVGFEAIPLDLVRNAVSGATRLRLVILDACRNNPFRLAAAPGEATRSVSRGLARVEPEAHEFIAYAAREGTTASDGAGGSSPYAESLVRHLATPGLEIRLLFGLVRDEVVKATAGAQEPFTYGTLGGEPVFLNPSPVVAEEKPAPAPAPAAGAGKSVDPRLEEAAIAWVTVKDTTSVALLQAYIARYKDTVFGALAEARLGELMATPKGDAADAGDAPPPLPQPPAEEEKEVAVGDFPPPDAPPPPPVARSLTLEPQVVPVGKWAEGLAFDGRSLWVAESGQRSIAEVDPESGAIRRRVSVGRLPVGMGATPDGRVFALVNTDRTLFLQPPGGAKGKRFAQIRECPWALALDATAIWIMTWSECSSANGRVIRVDPKSGRQSQTGLLGEWPQAVTAAFGRVFAVHARGGLINVIDADTLDFADLVVDGASFWDVTANSTRLFAAGRIGDDNASGLVVAVDPQTGEEVARTNLDQMVNHVAADDRSLVAVGLEGRIWILNPETLAIETVIDLTVGSYRPSDVLILGDSLAVVCQQCGGGENGAILAIRAFR